MIESNASHLDNQSFASRAVFDGLTLWFDRTVPGAGGKENVVLCTADDGKEFAVLASDWPRQSAN
jgi:hypothetical protein